jgi:hypothetical protein
VGPLVRAAVASHDNNLMQKVESLIHRAFTHTKLLEYQNQGLEASLTIKKKRKKSGKALLLQEACGKSEGGYFFLPLLLRAHEPFKLNINTKRTLQLPKKRTRRSFKRMIAYTRPRLLRRSVRLLH